MKETKPSSVSLLWRILFSTSIAITVLFLAVGWVLQEQFIRIASLSLGEEARASFQAYESLWQARADQLATVSLVLSRMPDVRASFSTGDAATIRDTAQEVWDQLSRPGTLFLVCDPRGTVIADVGPANNTPHLAQATFVPPAARRFPRQSRGFVVLNQSLYQIVVTPIYVAASHGTGLLNVLVAGIAVDPKLAHQLKSTTGDSDFVFLAGNTVVASTLTPTAERGLHLSGNVSRVASQVRLAGFDYYQFASPLTDIEGGTIGELRILRPFEAARHRISAMRDRLAALWIAAVLAGLGTAYFLTRRILQPVEALDRAATEIGKGNYDVRVSPGRHDEIGRLAETFNNMCASLNSAREDLIRQERISTIGRLSTSIVHDLRNPLAAIYGGAEMLEDAELSPPQVRRLAANIYRASRQIQSLLQELSDVTHGRAHAREMCRLKEIVQAAYEPLVSSAEASRVSVGIDVDSDIELPLDRSPMERVFQNLITNAIEAMPRGGSVAIHARRGDGDVTVCVEDTGPGIPEAIAGQLFQPFVTAGKKNGMGLGLAFSRKTILSHGGDLWVEQNTSGARFVIRLPA